MREGADPLKFERAGTRLARKTGPAAQIERGQRGQQPAMSLQAAPVMGWASVGLRCSERGQSGDTAGTAGTNERDERPSFLYLPDRSWPSLSCLARCPPWAGGGENFSPLRRKPIPQLDFCARKLLGGGGLRPVGRTRCGTQEPLVQQVPWRAMRLAVGAGPGKDALPRKRAAKRPPRPPSNGWATFRYRRLHAACAGGAASSDAGRFASQIQ